MKYLYPRFLVIFVVLLVLAPVVVAAPAINDLLSTGRMNDAVAALASHDDAQSLNLLSRVYYAMERWDDAVKYGERAVSLEPGNPTYHLWLAREYGRKAGDSKAFAAASNARKAKNEFERAVQLAPADIPARMDLAEYYTEAPGFMGGGVDKARDQASQIARYDAGASHLVLARVAVKEKQAVEAEAHFKAAIKQGRNPADMWLQLAGFYRQQGRLEEMQTAVQTAMAQSSKKADSYFDAAQELYLGGRDFPSAVQYLRKYLGSGELVESAPAFRAHYLVGQLNEKMGQKSAAASEYEASLRLASGFLPAKSALDRIR